MALGKDIAICGDTRLCEKDIKELMSSLEWTSLDKFNDEIEIPADVIGSYKGTVVRLLIPSEEWNKIALKITNEYINDLRNYFYSLINKETL
jgi:hypothetical protein